MPLTSFNLTGVSANRKILITHCCAGSIVLQFGRETTCNPLPWH